MTFEGEFLWPSKKKTVVALSTCKTEYFSIFTALREAFCLKDLVKSLILGMDGSMVISGYNQTSLKREQEVILAEASKHIAVYYHFIKRRY